MSYEKTDSEDGTFGGANTTRRKLMAAGAASWATVGLAGCSGNGGTTTTAGGETTTSQPQPADLVVTDDMVTGSESIPENGGFVSACSPTRKFTPGMHAIWDIGIYNPDTGEIAEPDLVESVQVSMSSSDVSAADGQTVEITWAGDDEENPHQYWNGAWTVPTDASTGTVEYEVEVSTTEGDSHLVGVAANEFQVINFKENWVVSSFTYAVEDRADSNGFVSSCSPEWQFAPGMKVLFNANVFDPMAKGTDLENEDPSVAGESPREPGPEMIDSVTLTFPNGEFEDKEMLWIGDEEEHAERVWEASVQLADDQATGTYTYEVVVESAADDVIDVNSAQSQFTVINPSG